MKRYLYIINPASQNGRTARNWPKMERQIPHVAEIKMTSRHQEAIAWAADARKNKFDAVIAVGGDGTIHEIVNGLMQTPEHERPALGLLPSGTGSDFRRTLGYPAKNSEIYPILEAGRTRSIDVIDAEVTSAHSNTQMERHFCVNIASFGFSAEIVREVNLSSKALGGGLSFFMGVVRALFKHRGMRIEMSCDDGIYQIHRVTLAAVCNGRQFGGGMKVAPMADPGDGLLDCIVVKSLSRFAILSKLWRFYDGSYLKLGLTAHQRAQSISLNAPGERVLVEMDGENTGILPARLKVVPSALQVIVP